MSGNDLQSSQPTDSAVVDLRRRLRRADRNLLGLLKQRLQLSAEYAEHCRLPKDEKLPASRTGVDLLDEVVEWSNEFHLAPDFVRSVMTTIADRRATPLESGPLLPPIEKLRDNLLALTAAVAGTYDRDFDSHFFATRAYRKFERELIEREILEADRSAALDLGCATGEYACRLSLTFERVVGVDISPAMIAYARKSTREKREDVLTFQEQDLDKSIPGPDSSASLVIMNLGTASEIKDAGNLLREIRRILRPGGRAVLSFYNSEAMVYRWALIPWGLSLAAEMSPRRPCLDVHAEGKVYSIYAKAYSYDELCGILPQGLRIVDHATYPTVGSILPNELFQEAGIGEDIEDIDYGLRKMFHGNYLVVVCQKH